MTDTPNDAPTTQPPGAPSVLAPRAPRSCANCGRPEADATASHCVFCGSPLPHSSGVPAGPAWSAPAGASELPATLTRTYQGKPEAAALLMRDDAARLGKSGYVAVSQNYAQGEWGCGAWVLAFLLMVLVIGIIVLAYMVVVHPEGTLTVVYERRVAIPPAPMVATAPAPAADATAAAPQAIPDQIRQLAALRDEGLITPDEYEAKRRVLLDRM